MQDKNKSPEDKIIIPIPLPKETVQHLLVNAKKKGITVEEYLVKLIEDSVQFLQMQEKMVKDVLEWKAPRLIAAIPNDDFSFNVKFEDGVDGKYDLNASIQQDGEFSALSDIEFFKKASINENRDFITWPGDINIGSDTIYWDVLFAADEKW